MKLLKMIYILLALLISACSAPSDVDVKQFFSKKRPDDYSPDAALMQKSRLSGQWDYIATFHGSFNPTDLEMCTMAAERLEQEFEGVDYTCQLLN